MNDPPRIYISAMETHVESMLVFDQDALKLLDKLKEFGFDVYWEKEWRDYKIIEKEIESCDALLAIVDSTWTSSTWMGSEVTWALGEGGAIKTNNPSMDPIPVFLYPVIEKSKWPLFPREYPGPIIISRDVEEAAAEICQKLKWRGKAPNN